MLGGYIVVQVVFGYGFEPGSVTVCAVGYGVLTQGVFVAPFGAFRPPVDMRHTKAPVVGKGGVAWDCSVIVCGWDELQG